MGCCGQAEEGDEDKRARKQNKEIEKQIQKDKQVNNSNKRTLSLSMRRAASQVLPQKHNMYVQLYSRMTNIFFQNWK